MSMSASNLRIISQKWKVGLFSLEEVFHCSKDSLSYTGPGLWRNASLWSLWRAKTVTWWPCLVRVRWVTFKNSAVPDDAIPASANAVVHPESSRRSPHTFHNAISMCNPPNITTCFLSPWTKGQLHWTNFAIANKGWSNAVTGICPGLRCAVARLCIFIPCLTIANEDAFS